MVFGANSTEAHPIIGLKIMEAAQAGAKLIVVDPRLTDLARRADLWLPLKPGTNVPLINGMLHVIFKENLYDEDFIAERTEGFEGLKKYILEEFPLDRVEAITRVPKEKIIEAAKLFATAERSMILYGLGVAEHKGGTEGVIALADLVLATGQVGREGAGINPLRGQHNVQGACDMGCLPYVLPGYQSPADPVAIKKFEELWGVAPPTEKGLMEPQMYQAALKGDLKALYIIGYDPAQTGGNAGCIREALKSLKLLIVQDIFLSETAKLAHVVLPGACVFEKEGTYTNGERRVRRFFKAVDPPGEALPDWQIVCRLAQAMGYPMKYDHPGQIMDEISRLAPPFKGISYQTLGPEGLHWPCPEPGRPGIARMHTESFPRGRAKFVPANYVPSEELPDRDYPFILITGRRLVHFNNGSMTRRAEGFEIIGPEELLEMNPQDAQALGIRDGQMVRVSSRRGKIKVRVKVTDKSQPGCVFMAFHHPETPVNLLTSPGVDTKTMTPEYKVCAVRVEPLP